jgi:hypothetical protein
MFKNVEGMEVIISSRFILGSIILRFEISLFGRRNFRNLKFLWKLFFDKAWKSSNHHCFRHFYKPFFVTTKMAYKKCQKTVMVTAFLGFG